MAHLSRRAWGFAAASLVLLGCRRRSRDQAPTSVPVPDAVPSSELELLDWSFPEVADGPRRCTVVRPRALPTTSRGVLVALHGMGETVSPEIGARGWVDRYRLDRAMRRLAEPPLTADDYEGFVTSDRLAEANRALAARPFRGLTVVCPYLPRGIGGSPTYDQYADWLREVLLARVRSELFSGTDHADAGGPEAWRANTGIDGVSLGGITALRVGLLAADTFGVVGALQPAIPTGGAAALADEVDRRLAGRPLRVVTSREDAYRAAVLELDQALSARSVPHELLVAEGPHDYAWNRGPGALEMLLWHDRRLNRDG